MISYAQNFEDVILNRIFESQTQGFYVDVGAGDPTFHSVTRWFYDRGWNGINVEPLIPAFERLVAGRPRDINLNCALGDAPQAEAKFFEISFSASNEPAVLGWSSLDPASVERAQKHGGSVVERTVKMSTLRDVCRQFLTGSIDFLKIDVEGWEGAVLAGADWLHFRPKIVLVEATRPNSPIPSHAEWEPILTQNGYLFAHFDGLNRFYVEQNHSDWIPRIAVPPNFFDHFVPFREIELEIRAAQAKESATALTIASEEARRAVKRAEERAQTADQRTQDAAVQLHNATQRMQDLEQRARQAEAEAQEAVQQRRAAEMSAREAAEQRQAAEMSAQAAEQRARRAEERSQESERRAGELDCERAQAVADLTALVSSPINLSRTLFRALFKRRS